MFYLIFKSDIVQPYFFVRIISCAPSLAVFSRVIVSKTEHTTADQDGLTLV